MIYGFMFTTFMCFFLFCFYQGCKAIYLKIKKDGFMKFLEAFFYLFLAVALTSLLSIKIGNTLSGLDRVDSYKGQTV